MLILSSALSHLYLLPHTLFLGWIVSFICIYIFLPFIFLWVPLTIAVWPLFNVHKINFLQVSGYAHFEWHAYIVSAANLSLHLHLHVIGLILDCDSHVEFLLFFLLFLIGHANNVWLCQWTPCWEITYN